MDRGLPPESLNKVLLDVALQKHDQSRVAVSSTQSLPSANTTNTTTSMPTTLTSPAHNTHQQSMQYMRNSSHAERQTTTTTITTAAASTSKVEGALVPGCHSLYPPSSYTHSNLPTQFSTAPNITGRGPTYVLDSHLHNLAASTGGSPLYTNLAGVAKSYGVGEAQHSYNAFSQNKLSTQQAFNNTQTTQGYMSSQSYNNNTQSYNNAPHDNLHIYNKEQNVSPKPAMSQDYALPKDYTSPKDYNMPKDFKPPKDYNDSKDYKNAAKDYNTSKGSSSGQSMGKEHKEGRLALQPGNPVRSCTEMQKYILLSPVLGPKPVLLSPMYDKADQSQARFVIVPMEVESNTRRSSCCPILPTASSPLLAIEDFTSCQLLQEEAKELVSRRKEVEEEMGMEAEGGMLHKTRDTTMQMLTHSRQETDKLSQIPMCVSLQRNNLMGGSGTRGAPTMSRDQHHMPDLLYNNKVNHPFFYCQPKVNQPI